MLRIDDFSPLSLAPKQLSDTDKQICVAHKRAIIPPEIHEFLQPNLL